MRIWSLHPKYLDSKGLVALWREALLARHVLEGKTQGYKNHPQLNRFEKASSPLECINQYLATVYNESLNRGYNFDKNKIDWNFRTPMLTVSSGQMDYERSHLLMKLKTRDIEKYNGIVNETKFESHPLFKVVDGGVEQWEKVLFQKGSGFRQS
jgi:hypothetical protein